MKTYNFIYQTKTGEYKQVDVNAESQEDAWKQLASISDEVTYVNLLNSSRKFKESKLLSKEFLNNFLLEAQHHSGLPLINSVSAHYIECLKIVKFTDDRCLTLMDDLIDNYMILIHKIHKRNKTWKSYDDF